MGLGGQRPGHLETQEGRPATRGMHSPGPHLHRRAWGSEPLGRRLQSPLSARAYFFFFVLDSTNYVEMATHSSVLA